MYPKRTSILISSIALGGLLILSGCSSTPVLVSQANESKDLRVTEYSNVSEKHPLQIIVILDRLVGGAALIRPQIFVNGTSIGTVKHGEKLTFYVSSGVLRLGWSALTKDNYREQEFIVSPDLRNVFHMVSPAGDILRFVRENEPSR
ncbi:MAG: hypothetical protein C0406_06950 [Sideroxydans sp.]|nr:hypothetical protein [Sideroxydans sp.]